MPKKTAPMANIGKQIVASKNFSDETIKTPTFEKEISKRMKGMVMNKLYLNDRVSRWFDFLEFLFLDNLDMIGNNELDIVLIMSGTGVTKSIATENLPVISGVLKAVSIIY